jgi:hypothetical protein
MFKIILDILGLFMVFTGFLDGWKYHISASTIRRIKSGKGNSRRFINYAILNDLTKLIYLILSAFIFKRVDYFLIFCSILALIFMLEHFYMLYVYYSYRMRGCINFHRPNILLYTINSWLPNRFRKRL